MANDNKPCGLKPITQPYGAVRASVYKAVTGAAIYMFSPVDQNASGYVELATAGSGNRIVGSVIGMLDGAFGPIDKTYGYIPANPSGVDSDGYMNVIVADDPQQEFIVAEASTGTALTAAARHAGINFYNTTTGNTRSGVSMANIDPTSLIAAGSNQQLRLIDKLDKYDNAFGAYCLWRCRIYLHRFNDPVPEAAAGTTV
ncbi:MAG TPA: hypothetical protein P5110_06950 [Candidatus Omnitrophota bacterium]|nr:hypothetical protein [Candidatus Omnitrophota bacterium]